MGFKTERLDGDPHAGLLKGQASLFGRVGDWNTSLLDSSSLYDRGSKEWPGHED